MTSMISIGHVDHMATDFEGAVLDEVVLGRPPVDFEVLDDDHYRLTAAGGDVQLEIDRLHRGREQDLFGELTVIYRGEVVSFGSLNLSSPVARTTRGKLARDQSDTEFDFVYYLEQLAQRTIAALRTGTPASPLHLFERPGPDGEHDVQGWRFLRDHPTILFGDGGSLKSYLALYAQGTLAQAGHRVLLCDAELSGGDHHDRLARLFGAELPLVHYLRCTRPLVEEADRIRREVRRLAIDFVVYDSIAPLCAGRPEEAEQSTEYFRKVRQIGAGSLHIAHINKSENGDLKPFGSSFWHNLARATFFAKQAGASADGRQVSIGLFQRKANLGPLRPPLGFQFAFESDRTRVTRIDLATVDGLKEQLPTWRRMQALLRSGALPVSTIAEHLELPEGTIRQTLKRDTDRAGKHGAVGMFTRVDGGLIGLAERMAS